MNNQPLKKLQLKIHGMHCASCEVLVERKFKNITGVEKVNVNHASGKADILCSREPSLNELDSAIQADGYHVSLWNQQGHTPESPHQNKKKDYLEIGAIFLIVVALYLILKQFNLVPQNLGISDNMSYGFVFLIGVVAATSTCIAVTGGLLLAVAGKYNEQNPNLSGAQKFKPHIYFNLGRIASYTLLGGAVGALGSVISFSPRANGFLTILASTVMILLGFQLLKLFPGLKRFHPKMPKFLAHKIHDLSGKDNKSAPFILGASTFFLPCGFTQALQLYVLSKGSFTIGALTMLAFSLGTLPALISLSAISSFAKGGFQRYFLKFSGVVVILLGFFNINNGLALTGSNINLASIFQPSNSIVAEAGTDTNVQIIDGKQVVNMKVNGLSYSPSHFTVVEGIPVEWNIDGTGAQGCAQVIVAPTLGVTEYLPQQGIKKITFTPKETGAIPFSCTMGMTTRGAGFTVVPNTTGIVAAPTETSPTNENQTSACNPNISDCVTAQNVSIEVSRERGIYPQTVTVKKGVPVDLTIDDKVPLGGCMSVWVIPKYNVTIPMKVGTIKSTFTPTEAGTIAMTCSMGGLMARINVVD